MIELYQFELSHYCEKIRLILDYKGLEYRKVEVTPGVGQQVLPAFGDIVMVALRIDAHLNIEAEQPQHIRQAINALAAQVIDLCSGRHHQAIARAPPQRAVSSHLCPPQRA